MKIPEIVGSYVDGTEQEIATNRSLLQTVANAFTRSGKVKRPLNQQLSDGPPIASQAPSSSDAASGADPLADSVSQDLSYARRLSAYSYSNPHKKCDSGRGI